jgi:hypothetical protein
VQAPKGPLRRLQPEPRPIGRLVLRCQHSAQQPLPFSRSFSGPHHDPFSREYAELAHRVSSAPLVKISIPVGGTHVAVPGRQAAHRLSLAEDGVTSVLMHPFANVSLVLLCGGHPAAIQWVLRMMGQPLMARVWPSCSDQLGASNDGPTASICDARILPEGPLLKSKLAACVLESGGAYAQAERSLSVSPVK